MFHFSPPWCGIRTHSGLHPQWAESGELPGHLVGRWRISRVERSLEGALRRGPRDHLRGGLQWQREDKGGQGGSRWPAETTKSGRKTNISVSVFNCQVLRNRVNSAPWGLMRGNAVITHLHSWNLSHWRLAVVNGFVFRLANKQDKMNALLGSELIEILSLETLVNQSRSLCHIVSHKS